MRLPPRPKHPGWIIAIFPPSRAPLPRRADLPAHETKPVPPLPITTQRLLNTDRQPLDTRLVPRRVDEHQREPLLNLMRLPRITIDHHVDPLPIAALQRLNHQPRDQLIRSERRTGFQHRPLPERVAGRQIDRAWEPDRHTLLGKFESSGALARTRITREEEHPEATHSSDPATGVGTIAPKPHET